MGVVNNDGMTLSSGLHLSNCYMSFTPGPLPFPYQPPPMSFGWTVDADGVKTYMASATLYIYTSKESKVTGLAPIEERLVAIPSEASSAMVGGVFAVFYGSLAVQYPNTTTDVPVDG